MDKLQEEYQRIELALDKYEKGELKIMATYSEIKKVEQSMIDLAGKNQTMKLLVRTLIETARLRVKEIKLNRRIG